MTTLKLIDSFLQMLPVRWLLLVLVVLLLIIAGVSIARQKALSVELELCKGANAQYIAEAEVNMARTAELEARIAKSAEEIKKVSEQYDIRIAKLKSTRITSDTCAGMIAESVKLLQGDGDAD